MVATNIYDEIVDFLADNNPKRLLDFHPSKENQKRIELLLEKNRKGNLSPEERKQLDYFGMLEHIIRLAKIKAMRSLKR